MHPIVSRILSQLEAADPTYGQQLRKRLAQLDERYLAGATEYFQSYDAALRLDGKSIDYAIDCYVRLSQDMTLERMNFIRTGKYANSSYKEVEQRIYSNPSVMDYHMHGLALAQYLWPDQYERLEFFRQNLSNFASSCAAYLEVGGGHGLYVKSALTLLPENARVDLLDISPSSIRLAQQIIGPSKVNYILEDIFMYHAPQRYDFITAGEIIEHLEDPRSFLIRISDFLAPGGAIYLTTPVNAPMIDHIYLFNNVQEIRDMVTSAGLRVVAEKSVASRDLPERLIARQKLPVMYAAFLRKT